jgi:cytochrome c-type biogenesis protein CcmH/NrfG
LSVPDVTSRLIDRYMGRIVLVCVIGTCLCLAGLSYLQVQVWAQARAGQAARARQIRVFPVSCKEHEDAWQRGVITRHDLVVVWACPAP